MGDKYDKDSNAPNKQHPNTSTRCRKGTPSVLLNYALGHVPLSQKVLETALKRAFTIKSQGHWRYEPVRPEDTYPTTCQQIDAFIKNNIKIDPRTNTDEIIPVNNLKRNLKVNKTSTKLTYCPPKEPENDERVHIFTDGSKDQDGNTGYGIFFQNNETEPLKIRMKIITQYSKLKHVQ